VEEHLVDGGYLRTEDLERAHAEDVALFVPPKPARKAERRGRELEPRPGTSDIQITFSESDQVSGTVCLAAAWPSWNGPRHQGQSRSPIAATDVSESPGGAAGAVSVSNGPATTATIAASRHRRNSMQFMRVSK